MIVGRRWHIAKNTYSKNSYFFEPSCICRLQPVTITNVYNRI